MFDKIYRSTLEADKIDKMCLRPPFAKSGAQLSCHEPFSSGAIAYLRSDDECHVKQMKRCKITQQEIPLAWFDLKLLDNIWICWEF